MSGAWDRVQKKTDRVLALMEPFWSRKTDKEINKKEIRIIIEEEHKRG